MNIRLILGWENW